MEKQFNLYDFLVYVLPGFLFLLLFWGFTKEFVDYPDVQSLKDMEFAGGLFILGISYVIGHLIQASRWRLPLPLLFGSLATPYYSIYLLLEHGEEMPADQEKRLRIKKPLSSELRANVKKALSETFWQISTVRQYQDAWTLARSFLAQRAALGHSEIYNSMANLHGALTFVLYIAALFGVLVNPALHLWKQTFCGHLYHIFVSFLCGLLFLLLSYVTNKQFHHLSQLFASSVYQGFYTYLVRPEKTD